MDIIPSPLCSNTSKDTTPKDTTDITPKDTTDITPKDTTSINTLQDTISDKDYPSIMLCDDTEDLILNIVSSSETYDVKLINLGPNETKTLFYRITPLNFVLIKTVYHKFSLIIIEEFTNNQLVKRTCYNNHVYSDCVFNGKTIPAIEEFHSNKTTFRGYMKNNYFNNNGNEPAIQIYNKKGYPKEHIYIENGIINNFKYNNDIYPARMLFHQYTINIEQYYDKGELKDYNNVPAHNEYHKYNTYCRNPLIFKTINVNDKVYAKYYNKEEKLIKQCKEKPPILPLPRNFGFKVFNDV